MTENNDFLPVHQTNGGPFALIPRAKLSLWGGVRKKKLARGYSVYANDYELASRSNLDIDYHDLEGQDALFIEGAQYAVLSISERDALKFMCAFTIEDERVCSENLKSAFEEIDWTRSNRLKLAAGDDYCLFDSAYSGAEVLAGLAKTFEAVALPRAFYFLYFRPVTLTLVDGNVLDGFACMTRSEEFR